jgi:hypothetical protein
MTARSLSTQSEIARQGCAHGFFQGRVLAEKPGVRCRATPCLRRKTDSDQASLVQTAPVLSFAGAGADHMDPWGAAPASRQSSWCSSYTCPVARPASTRGL